MDWDPQERLWKRQLTRRDFLVLASAGGVALCGCATDPVTGGRTLVLMSESQEIGLDHGQSPHQFSRDYGVSQDSGLNAYVAEVGQGLARVSHRPGMPYRFQVVNANSVNAYAFPGGSIAATRGILLKLEDESELAALLGHEIGHVAARHAAERQAKALLMQIAVAGATAALATSKYRDYAGLAEALGGLGSTALLAHYSRDAERESDDLGMAYAANAGANPTGMVGLMEVLLREGRSRPSAFAQMFATHPMSSERHAIARQRAEDEYAGLSDRPRNRERYQDQTAGLRRIASAIDALQTAEAALADGNIGVAEPRARDALASAPEDYAALVLMAKIQLAKGDLVAAKGFAARGQSVYPTEAQAHHLSGVADVGLNQYDAAFAGFSNYERLLPGNPNTIFLKGVSLEGMNRRSDAAREYFQYLRSVKSGDKAQYAYQRLVDWGILQRR